LAIFAGFLKKEKKFKETWALRLTLFLKVPALCRPQPSVPAVGQKKNICFEEEKNT
jgi:hypothetical protein